MTLESVRIQLDNLLPLQENAFSQFVDIIQIKSRYRSKTRACFNYTNILEALEKMHALSENAQTDVKKLVEGRMQALFDAIFHVEWDFGTSDKDSLQLCLKEHLSKLSSPTKQTVEKIQAILKTLPAENPTKSEVLHCHVPLALRLQELPISLATSKDDKLEPSPSSETSSSEGSPFSSDSEGAKSSPSSESDSD